MTGFALPFFFLPEKKKEAEKKADMDIYMRRGVHAAFTARFPALSYGKERAAKRKADRDIHA